MASPFGPQSAADLLPFAGLVSPDQVKLKSGGYLSMLVLPGRPFELEEASARNALAYQINALLRQIGDDNVTLTTHLVRHRLMAETAPGGLRSAYAAELDADYRRHIAGRLRENIWFVAIEVKPHLVNTGLLDSLKRLSGKGPPPHSRALREQLRSITRTVLETLAPYGARQLGYRQEGRVTFTETGEALYLIRICRYRKTPVTNSPLSDAIATDRVVFETNRQRARLHLPSGVRYLAMLGLREYPHATFPDQLSGLLSLDADLVLSQSFSPLTRPQALGRLHLKDRQEHGVSGEGSLTEGLAELIDGVNAGITVMGAHHLALAVFADSPQQLQQAVNAAEGRLADAGATPAVEDVGLEPAHLSVLPGTGEWQTRPGAISGVNFGHLSALHNFPAGEAEGFWGPAIARFVSAGGTPFDLVTHVEDVGHWLIFGRSGSGKTALMTFLAAMLERVGSTGLIFDKDRGTELLVRFTGGRYLALRQGRPSGLAPLRGLSGSEADLAFLKNLFAGLIQLDGKGGLSPDEDSRLARGIRRQMALPPEQRSLLGVRELLGYGDPNGAGARFEKWCRGGELGWLFDNEADWVRHDAHLLAYDFTELLPSDERLQDDGLAAAAAAYLIHRVRAAMDGRRLWIFCDECRFYLPVIGRVLEGLALTGRKKDLALFLAAQEPEHLTAHPVGLSLVTQARTVIAFPNGNASRGYIDALRFTPAEYAQITEDMLVGLGRRFLLKRESGSVVCDFDLSSLPHHLKVLSARASTIALLDRLMAVHGDDPAVLWPAFRAALEGRPLPSIPLAAE